MISTVLLFQCSSVKPVGNWYHSDLINNRTWSWSLWDSRAALLIPWMSWLYSCRAAAGESEGHAAVEFSVDRACPHSQWHFGTALSWYETEPAWKTRNDRISVLPLLNIVPFENSQNQYLKGESNWQRWNHRSTNPSFLVPESPWISPRESELYTSLKFYFLLQIQDVWSWGHSSSASKHLFFVASNFYCFDSVKLRFWENFDFSNYQAEFFFRQSLWPVHLVTDWGHRTLSSLRT